MKRSAPLGFYLIVRNNDNLALMARSPPSGATSLGHCRPHRKLQPYWPEQRVNTPKAESMSSK